MRRDGASDAAGSRLAAASRSGARLEHGIGQSLGRLDRPGRPAGSHQQGRRKEGSADHPGSARRRAIPGMALAVGTRRRERRSLSETIPPNAARTVPNQTQGTRGL